jgi:uncharacterized protein
LVLWNTLRGPISVFKAEQAPLITELLKGRDMEGPPADLLKYLVDRGFMVKRGENEFRQFQFLFGHQHYRASVLELFLLASEDCNFRCTYCYEKFARGTMQPQVRQGVKRLVEKRIEQLTHLFVAWFGGEPLYGWEAMEELSTAFIAMAEEHDIHYGSSITTNGYLLTPDVVEKLLAWHVQSYQITIDGPPERHDSSRPGRDGSPTFATILENIQGMAKRPDEFNVVLRINYDQDNTPYMEELFNILQRGLGSDERFRLQFHPVGRWGGPNDDNLNICGLDSEKIVARLKAAAHARGLRLSTLRSANLPGAQVCYAARPYNLVIGASGKVMKCTVALESEEHNVLGRITPDGELKLDGEKLARWTEPAFEHDEQCKRCFVLPTCQGACCPRVRMNENRSPCPPLRKQFKRELVEAVGYQGGSGRRRDVLLSR